MLVFEVVFWYYLLFLEISLVYLYLVYYGRFTFNIRNRKESLVNLLFSA